MWNFERFWQFPIRVIYIHKKEFVKCAQCTKAVVYTLIRTSQVTNYSKIAKYKQQPFLKKPLLCVRDIKKFSAVTIFLHCIMKRTLCMKHFFNVYWENFFFLQEMYFKVTKIFLLLFEIAFSNEHTAEELNFLFFLFNFIFCIKARCTIII